MPSQCIYIAARFSRRPECNQLAHALKDRGAVITSRWVKPDCDHVLPTGLSRQAEDHERQRFALEDVDDVRAANWTISLMEEPRSNTRGGRHIEFGLALALGHRLTIIGPRETVFHHLPHVEHYDTIDQFVASLPARFEASLKQAAPAMTREAPLTVEAYNELYDPADEAGRDTFYNGFREGFLYAKFPEGYDATDADEAMREIEDIAIGEAWGAYRDEFFRRLPIAAVPDQSEIGKPFRPAQPDSAREAFTFAFARGFQIAEETSRPCISTIDDAWKEYLAALSTDPTS